MLDDDDPAGPARGLGAPAQDRGGSLVVPVVQYAAEQVSVAAGGQRVEEALPGELAPPLRLPDGWSDRNRSAVSLTAPRGRPGDAAAAPARRRPHRTARPTRPPARRRRPPDRPAAVWQPPTIAPIPAPKAFVREPNPRTQPEDRGERAAPGRRRRAQGPPPGSGRGGRKPRRARRSDCCPAVIIAAVVVALLAPIAVLVLGVRRRRAEACCQAQRLGRPPRVLAARPWSQPWASPQGRGQAVTDPLRRLRTAAAGGRLSCPTRYDKPRELRGRTAPPGLDHVAEAPHLNRMIRTANNS